MVHQASITNQGLAVSKFFISKKTLIIPRLELVSAHTASNLQEMGNCIETLQNKINNWVGT